MAYAKPRRTTTRIRFMRLGAGIGSQQELADRVRVARTTITAIETGASIPAVTLAIAIARELGTTVEELWGRMPPGV